MTSFVIAYDVETTTVSGRRRLRHMAATCCAYGVRVQKSVFEVRVPAAKMMDFLVALETIIDPGRDTVRLYPLSRAARERVRTLGLPPRFDSSTPFVI